MTNENIFKEIEDDLERQKYEDLWKRYGGLVIAAAVAIVVGTAGINFWQDHTETLHQKASGELIALTAQEKTDPAKTIDALQSFAAQNPGQSQATLAQLEAAALAAKQGNKDQAAKLYDAVAGDAQADHAYRQLADLFYVQLQLDSGDAAALQKRLEPLMANDEPWRYSAMEYSGYVAMRAGDKVLAKKRFTDLSQDASAPKSISTRAADVLKVLAE